MNTLLRQNVGRSTLADVAELSGVSRSLVSKVLSGRGDASRVSAATAERVRRIARSLHYRPTMATRILREKRSMTLAVVLAGVAPAEVYDAYSGVYLRSVIQAATALGYETLVAIANDDNMEQRVSHLLDRDADGLLLFGLMHFNQTDVYRELVATRRPVVSVEHDVFGDAFDFVGMDNLTGYREAVGHLKQLGHRKIGFIYEHEAFNLSAHRRRIDFEQAIVEAGLPVLPQYYLQSVGAANEAELVHTCGPQREITALVIRGYGRTRCVSQQLAAMSVRVPQDLSIVNVTGHSYEEERVRFDSIRTPLLEMGSTSVKLLVKRINTPDAPRRHVLLPGRLVPGETCAPAANGHGTGSGSMQSRGN